MPTKCSKCNKEYPKEVPIIRHDDGDKKWYCDKCYWSKDKTDLYTKNII